jgi:putative pyruvate formate lyase activating enzyme
MNGSSDHAGNGTAYQGRFFWDVMPGRLEDTRQILTWIADNLSPKTHVNVMGQYHPAHNARQHPQIASSLSMLEYQLIRTITHQPPN